MRTMWDDLRHAIRSLRRSGRTTAVAILLFAVTIGVTTAIYAVVEAVILRPSAMRRPDRTEVVWQRDGARGTPVDEVSYGEAAAWQQGTRLLNALGVFSSVNWSLSLIQGESRSRVSFAAVSPSFFEVVGVAPAQGRVLTGRAATSGTSRRCRVGFVLLPERAISRGRHRGRHAPSISGTYGTSDSHG